jgi:hypothetical protein
MIMQSFFSSEDSAALLQSDRRTSHRIACDPPRLIYVLARPALQRTPAYVCNFSVRGLGIATDQPFNIGTLLLVQLHRRDVGLSGMLTAKVVHRFELPSGKWYSGCSLSRRLTDEEQAGLRNS